ncbi:MAG: thiolase family protein [Dehalococcoidia bacterium]|nr:thiolase family protein [Dehalococcoidia bacterium]
MNLRGAAAVVGICELKPERERPDRDLNSLLAEVSLGAIRDAGLRKQDIECLIMQSNGATDGGSLNETMSEYLGIQPTFAAGINAQGASGVAGLAEAAAFIAAGLANYVLVATANPVDPNAGGPRRGRAGRAADPFTTEWQIPYGPVVGQNGYYAMIAQRHEHLYGLNVEKRAKIAVDQRINANHNPDAFFFDTPITTEDVANSRLIADPLHLLECVMPCSGGAAYVVARSDLATYLPHPPAYILGGACCVQRVSQMHMSDFAFAPVERAAKKTFAMAGYGPRDMSILELYDSYTITVICELEESGFCAKGEAGDWLQEQDFTFRGNLPLNTHGGQMSFGQPNFAGGFSQVMEGVRQVRGEAGEHQATKDVDLVYLTGSGGVFAVQSAAVLAREPR